MKIKQISGNTMHLVVMPSAKALIGQYEVFVETKMTTAAGKKLVFRYKDDDTIYVLFNAWCKGNRNTVVDKYRLRWLGEVKIYVFSCEEKGVGAKSKRKQPSKLLSKICY